MKLHIIKIGNSLGIKIPKAILDQCGFKGSVTLSVEDGKLILSPYQERQGWEEACEQMAEQGDDRLLDIDEIESSLIRRNGDGEYCLRPGSYERGKKVVKIIMNGNVNYKYFKMCIENKLFIERYHLC